MLQYCFHRNFSCSPNGKVSIFHKISMIWKQLFIISFEFYCLLILHTINIIRSKTCKSYTGDRLHCTLCGISSHFVHSSWVFFMQRQHLLWVHKSRKWLTPIPKCYRWLWGGSSKPLLMSLRLDLCSSNFSLEYNMWHARWFINILAESESKHYCQIELVWKKCSTTISWNAAVVCKMTTVFHIHQRLPLVHVKCD